MDINISTQAFSVGVGLIYSLMPDTPGLDFTASMLLASAGAGYSGIMRLARGGAYTPFARTTTLVTAMPSPFSLGISITIRSPAPVAKRAYTPSCALFTPSHALLVLGDAMCSISEVLNVKKAHAHA